MLGRIADWWRAQKEWRRTHLRTFAEVAVVDSEGVTVFQRRLMDAIDHLIPRSAFRRESWGAEPYFVADVPGTNKKLFVYSTEAQFALSKTSINADRWPFEEWDYRTPDDLIAAVVEDVKNAV